MSVRWVLLLFVFVGAAQAETVKAVFKTNPILSSDTSDLKRFTFGLNSEQVSDILRLTNGEVNMGNVFYIERDNSQISVLQDRVGFSGVIYPNVPPPVVVKGFDGDPELAGQWWIDSLHVKEAWPLATGAGVVVADCDAGFYHDESDLNSNMLLDFKYDLSDPVNPDVVNDGPYAYHGTAVSAIIAGVTDGKGTSGIAYNAKIVPLQNFNYDSKDTLDKEEATAACILRAIQTPHVNVIVLENQTANGSSETFIGTRDAVRLAIKSGITVVGAGGNYSVEIIEEKKDDTGSIIVGALAQTEGAAYFTNFGDRLTVGAFGENLHTLYGPNGAFGKFGGTSGATPQVAATVAMMKEVNPLLTPEQMRELLIQTREVNTTNEKAGGKLNVLAAVTAAINTIPDVKAWAGKQFFRQKLTAILNRRETLR